jgi:uncharacterized membrane protein (UPF0182 family)
MTNTTTFYNKADLWEVSPDPGSGEVAAPSLNDATAQTPTTTNTPQAASSTGKRIDPIYLLVRLPGDKTEQFILLRPFVPVSKGNALQNLVSFMVAKSDPAQYGDLQSFTMPTGKTAVDGPVQVNSTILNTAAISQQFTLLNQQGSRVVQGSLQLIPIEDSLLYIRPIYVLSASQKQPAFRFVVVFYAGQAVIDTTVKKALAQIPQFQGIATPSTPGGTGGTGGTGGATTNPTVESLLNQATSVYNDAQDALKAGDFAQYGTLSKQLGQLLQQASDALANPSKAGSSNSSTSTTSSSTTTTTSGSGGSQAAGARH